MHIIHRRIIINGVKYDIWLGLVNKSRGRGGKTNIQLYYYAGDPQDPLYEPQPLKSGFGSEADAIAYGKEFMRDLLKNSLLREADVANRPPEPVEAARPSPSEAVTPAPLPANYEAAIPAVAVPEASVDNGAKTTV